jgi:hypothetical protein
VTASTTDPRRLAALVLAGVYYALALMLAHALLASSAASAQLQHSLSQMDSAEERTDTVIKDWMETLSFGLYDGASRKARDRAEVEAQVDSYDRHVRTLSLSLAVLSAGFLLLLWLALGPRDIARRPRLLLHLHGVAGICLLVGLLAPMLSVVARSEVVLLGKVVFQYQSKGILDTVGALYAGGNLFTAAMLGLFSVLVPVLKLGLSLGALLAWTPRIRSACLAVVKSVGKWSMTDVFVVAVLLAFLALGDGAVTDARLGPGLYFFAGYGLLSLVGGAGLSRYRAG